MAIGFDATMVAAIGFATFIGGLIYLKVPGQLTKALDDQSAKISKELAEAKRLREEAQALYQSYQAQQAQAAKDAAAIIAKADEDAIRLKAEAEVALDHTIKARAKQAEERIARAEQAAISEVRSAASQAAISVAETVMKSSLKGKAAEALVSSGIANIAAKFS